MADLDRLSSAITEINEVVNQLSKQGTEGMQNATYELFHVVSELRLSDVRSAGSCFCM
jgi:hypothetical protein